MTTRLFQFDRRQFLVGGTVSLAAAASFFGAGGAAGAQSAADRKFVLIMLRGGMDGLHLAPPYGEPSYAAARGAIAIAAPGTEKGALKLDGLFGLHPAMTVLHGLYHGGEAALVQGVAPPYALRSHFSAQDILENGTSSRAGRDGWLARALNAREGATHGGIEALSFGSTLAPLALQGSGAAAAWSPSDPNMRKRTKAAVGQALARDPLFKENFAHVAALDALSPIAPKQFRGDTPHQWTDLTRAAGRLMKAPGGPDTAVIDLYGWDSHAYMGGADGNWSLLAKEFDAALASLKEGLGELWAKTAAVAVTEFGRTVEVNGTGGTDHGVGGTAVVLGGAIKGSQILGDWPGLAPQDRFEGRDVRATTDVRALFKGLLAGHWGLDEARLSVDVFPESADIASMDNLFSA